MKYYTFEIVIEKEDTGRATMPTALLCRAVFPMGQLSKIAVKIFERQLSFI